MNNLRGRIENRFESLTRWLYRNRLKVLLLMFSLIALLTSRISDLTIDTSSEEMLHASDPIRVELNTFKEQFGNSEYSVIVVESSDLFDPVFLERLKELHADLESGVPYLYQVTSLINVRSTRGEGDTLIVDELLKGWPEEAVDLDEIRSFALSNIFYRNHIVSENGRFTAIIVENRAAMAGEGEALAGFDEVVEPSDTPSEAAEGIIPSLSPGEIAEIRDAIDQIVQKHNGEGFPVIYTGSPVIVENRAAMAGEGEALAGFDDMDEPSGAAGDAAEGIIPSLSPGEIAEIRDAIDQIVQKHNGEGFPVIYTGSPVIVDAFNRETERDMQGFTLLTSVAIVGFLLLLFRRLTGVLFPLVIVFSATSSTLGLMVLFGSSISMMTTVIPAFLTAVGIADAIHVLAIFYRNYQAGATKERAICKAMGHSGLAIVMTSLTTAAGLLSFSMAEVATIADMGIFASLGVMLALFYTIVLLPALIALFPIRLKPQEKEGRKAQFMDRFLLLFARAATNRPVSIVAVSLVLGVFSIWHILGLSFSSNIITYFPDTYQPKLDLQAAETQFQGTVAFEVLIDTHQENGIHDPAILCSMEKLTRQVLAMKREDIQVGKVISIVDILKEINQALHGNDPAFYTIPQNRDIIAQEFFVFESTGSDDLEEVTDSRFSKTRLTIKTRWTDSVVYSHFSRDIQKMFQDEFEGRAEITVTGICALLGRTVPAAMHSMARSYGIALIVITLMMFLLVGRIKLGLLSMIPNLLPIVMVMGLIHLAGLTLDFNTLFIGSIAIGLVVDDTIHFMYNFRKYLSLTQDPVRAIEETLLGTGRALLITSVVLCGSFFTLLTGSLNHTRVFGLFTALVILFALLADFILAPALLILATRSRQVGAVAQTGEGISVGAE